jgi:hypothetical protein
LFWVEGEAYCELHGDDREMITSWKHLWQVITNICECKRFDLGGVVNVWKTSNVCKRNCGVLHGARINIKQCFSPWFTFLLNNFFGIGHKLKQKELSLVDIMISLQRCKYTTIKESRFFWVNKQWPNGSRIGCKMDRSVNEAETIYKRK